MDSVLSHVYGTTSFIWGATVCIIYTYSSMYVCMYSQHCLYKLGQQVLYIGSYCIIILTVLCGIPMYNIVWAMLTVWDNWFLK